MRKAVRTMAPNFNYVIARGHGFDEAGRPMFLVADAVEQEGEGDKNTCTLADLPIAAKAVERDEAEARSEHGRQGPGFGNWKGVDPDSEEAIRKAAESRRWIVLVGTQGMPDGEDGVQVFARKAFVASESFDPTASDDFVQLSHDEALRQLGFDPEAERSPIYTPPPMLLDWLRNEAAAERAKQEPDEAIVWVREDGFQVCVAHRGAYLFWKAPAYGPECMNIGFPDNEEGPGFHYFSGKVFVDYGGPSNDYEYDEGMIGTYEPLTDAHLERFGVTWESLNESIRKFQEKLESERVQRAGPSPA